MIFPSRLRTVAASFVYATGCAIAGATLTGCGFAPLYAEPGVASGLAHVAIETPAHSRTGYLLRQRLDDELGRARGEPPLYNLRLEVDERRFARGVRVNNVAARYEIRLTVTYTLEDIRTGKPLLHSAATADVSYDSADAPYAGVAASQEGFERAANEAAIRIRTDVARWLASHPR